MEREKVVAEIGPTNALPIWADADPEESWEDGQHDEWDGDSYNDWTGAGYVAAAHDEEEHEDDGAEFLEDEDLAAALLAIAECDNDETPAEELDELASAAQQLVVGYWLPAPTRARARATESLLGKARTTAKASMPSEPNSQLRTESSV